MYKPTYGITADHNVNNSLKSSRLLLNKSKDRNKYPLRNTSTLLPIISWKITKKRPHIISDILIPNRLPHCEISHRFKLKLTHQVCQIRINDCYIVSLKDFYSYVKLLYQTYMLVYHTLSQEWNRQPSVTKTATCK